MTNKAVAVAGMTLAVIPPATGQVKIISAPSITTRVAGKGVYSGPVKFKVTQVRNAQMGMAKLGTVYIGVIYPTAIITKADNQKVIRVGDKVCGLLAPDATQPAAPSPLPSPIMLGVNVKHAGQSKVKAK
ncbi:MAG: hypothetical protein ACI8WB_001031 [Phenylobacterium sp.]|jgi:hypothetical protein